MLFSCHLTPVCRPNPKTQESISEKHNLYSNEGELSFRCYQAIQISILMTKYCFLFPTFPCVVDIKSLHTPIKMSGFCDVKKKEKEKNYTKVNHVRTFSTFIVKLQLINVRENQ